MDIWTPPRFLGVDSLRLERETSTSALANFSREFANLKREFANPKRELAQFKRELAVFKPIIRGFDQLCPRKSQELIYNSEANNGTQNTREFGGGGNILQSVLSKINLQASEIGVGLVGASSLFKENDRQSPKKGGNVL